MKENKMLLPSVFGEDLFDEDDAPFGGCHVVGGHLQQPREDTLHVFAHVAGFGEHRGVDWKQGG